MMKTILVHQITPRLGGDQDLGVEEVLHLRVNQNGIFLDPLPEAEGAVGQVA